MKLTNNAPGARGVNLKDGTTVWVDPGKTVEVKDADVSHAHDDLEKGDAAARKAAKDEAEPA
jgi:hypothetical protein